MRRVLPLLVNSDERHQRTDLARTTNKFRVVALVGAVLGFEVLERGAAHLLGGRLYLRHRRLVARYKLGNHVVKV
jgi:hypothetical protein